MKTEAKSHARSVKIGFATVLAAMAFAMAACGNKNNNPPPPPPMPVGPLPGICPGPQCTMGNGQIVGSGMGVHFTLGGSVKSLHLALNFISTQPVMDPLYPYTGQIMAQGELYIGPEASTMGCPLPVGVYMVQSTIPGTMTNKANINIELQAQGPGGMFKVYYVNGGIGMLPGGSYTATNGMIFDTYLQGSVVFDPLPNGLCTMGTNVFNVGP